jgi:hypothetical protein
VVKDKLEDRPKELRFVESRSNYKLRWNDDRRSLGCSKLLIESLDLILQCKNFISGCSLLRSEKRCLLNRRIVGCNKLLIKTLNFFLLLVHSCLDLWKNFIELLILSF